MAKQERPLLDNLGAGTSYWQYRHNPEECEIQLPLKQENQNTDDTWIILLCILFTIGFLALLAKTTFWSML